MCMKLMNGVAIGVCISENDRHMCLESMCQCESEVTPGAVINGQIQRCVADRYTAGMSTFNHFFEEFTTALCVLVRALLQL